MKKAVFIALMVSFDLMAGGLAPTISFPGAALLPKGIRTFNYVGIYNQINSKRNDLGEVEDLGGSTNISYQKLIDAEETEIDKNTAEGIILANGQTPEDLMAVANLEANLGLAVHSVAAGYGVNEKWTVAMALGIYQKDYHFDYGTVASDSLPAIAQAECENGLCEKITEIQDKVNRAVEIKVEESGYDDLEDRNVTQLGDVMLMSNYQVLKNSKATVVFTNLIVAPTGDSKDLNKFGDTSAGDGQFDLGAGVQADYRATKDGALTFSGNVSYTAQLPDTYADRVPEESGEKVFTADIDNNIKRDLGDIFSITPGVSYKFTDALKLSGAYTYSYKFEDSYSGRKYEGARYRFLEEETEEELHSALFGVEYSTINAFRAKKFPVPMGMQLNYGSVLYGRNVEDFNFVSFNAKLFF
ncbi:MAG: hypothetical protein ACPGJV_08365 [Bacteriovoracaceae bacterium]